MEFIWVIQGRGDIENAYYVGKRLHKLGHRLEYIPSSTGMVRKMNESKFDFPTTHDEILYHEPSQNLPHLLEKYRIPSLRSFVFHTLSHSISQYNHDYIWGENYERIITDFHRVLDYCHDLYENGPSPLPIMNQGGAVLPRTLNRVATISGEFPIWIGFSPLQKQSIIYDNENKWIPELKESNYNGLTNGQISEANSIVHKFLDKKPYYGGSDFRKTKIDLYREYINVIKTNNINSFPIIYNFLRDGVLNIPKKIRSVKRRFNARSSYLNIESSKKYIENSKYIFYPIQVSSESRVTIRANAYYDQGWIIDYLSRNMPSGYDLVVKDHPHNIGLLPDRVINIINKCAIGVNPNLRAWDVANSADAIVILNNTVGFESILQKKPVVVLGNAFYSGCGYTFDLKELTNLKDVLYSAVNSKGLDDQELIEFVCGIKKASWPGRLNDYSDDNVGKLTNSIVEFARHRLNDE